jgi:hypothetical protein
MVESKESLRQQLLAARANIRTQIDRLRGLPTPLAGIGLEPVRANGLATDGDKVLTKLIEMLGEIDDSLEELGDGS